MKKEDNIELILHWFKKEEINRFIKVLMWI
jgi:hypothetical protein